VALMALTEKQRLGALGEATARTMLERKGLLFVEANWHCPIGELDLIMTDGEELAIIEVKARRGERNGRAEESVGRGKAKSLLAAAEWYVSEHQEHAMRIWRIDLLALTFSRDDELVRFAHIENAIVAG
jgi:putative endonuclease